MVGLSDMRRYPTAEADRILHDVWIAPKPAA